MGRIAAQRCGIPAAQMYILSAPLYAIFSAQEDDFQTEFFGMDMTKMNLRLAHLAPATPKKIKVEAKPEL